MSATSPPPPAADTTPIATVPPAVAPTQVTMPPASPVAPPPPSASPPPPPPPPPPSQPPSPPIAAEWPAGAAAALPPVVLASAAVPAGGRAGWLVAAALLGGIGIASLALSIVGYNRVRVIEHELVRRQQDAQTQAGDARSAARQALDAAQALETRLGVLDARVAETALQRTQVEELVQQMSRSRDENALADIEAALRVAAQQSAITGGVEPLLVALRQADERLARLAQPRLDRVRRAVTHDLEAAKAATVADLAGLVIRLDEAIRVADELPLLSQFERRPPVPGPVPAARAPAPVSGPAAAASSASAPAFGVRLGAALQEVAAAIWAQARDLVRVTRVDDPQAALMAPEQAWFVRENLKLRLLNARLALLARQFDTAQADLRETLAMIERYFDRGARRTQHVAELLRGVAAQARQAALPRIDDTLAAIAATQSAR